MKSPIAPLALCLAAALATAHAAPAGLAASASAFVRAQANSPVKWETWGPDALARAKAENKPVYIFVGSFLSELSRATCEQSFANADLAAYFNQQFVCVLVDSEERPDVAACARLYLQAVKQTAGWPAHLWLTPELQPYEGASYLPPSEEWGRSSLSMVAHQAGGAWTADPRACRAHGAEAIALMSARSSEALPDLTAAALAAKLDQAAAAWRATADAEHGGFGTAPKSPEPELLRFLLHGSPADRDAALATLRALAAGAIHDPLDGGFFTRATDAAWRVPYLQKTLADQARLALAFLDAAQVSGDAALARAASGCLDYAVKTLGRPDGGFAASEDSSRGDAAAACAWTATEIDAALGADAAAFKAAFGVQPGGNVAADDDPSGALKGRNLLFRATPPGDAAAEARLAAAAAKLRAVRAQRAAPVRDDRATAGAHGLILAALSRAGAQLGDKNCLATADRVLAVIKAQFVKSPDGDLRRLREDDAPAGPSDYAAVALGCREFAAAASQPEATALADRLLARAGSLFFDAPDGRYFAASAPLATGLFVRAPAVPDPLSAESLALLAGAPADQAAAVKKSLAAQLTEGATPPGDVLLALRQ